MKTYIPQNIEIFSLTAQDFLTAEEGTWQDDIYRAKLAEDKYLEMNEAAESLAGYYWWSCSPGCLPEGDASGPFDTEDEAIEDAGGGEYEEVVIALAQHLDCEPADISEEGYKHYDALTIYSHGGNEYAVGTDEEADEAWEASLDSYIEECITPEIEKLQFGNLGNYITFDEESWKRDARMDGRGHSLSGYDGNENEETVDGETFYIFRTN